MVVEAHLTQRIFPLKPRNSLNLLMLRTASRLHRVNRLPYRCIPALALRKSLFSSSNNNDSNSGQVPKKNLTVEKIVNAENVVDGGDNGAEKPGDGSETVHSTPADAENGSNNDQATISKKLINENNPKDLAKHPRYKDESTLSKVRDDKDGPVTENDESKHANPINENDKSSNLKLIDDKDGPNSLSEPKKPTNPSHKPDPIKPKEKSYALVKSRTNRRITNSVRKNESQLDVKSKSPPPFYPLLLPIPLTKRPLFPGLYKSLYIKEPLAVQAIQKLMAQKQPYIGIFLSKNENLERDVVMDMTQVESVGVFAEITSVFQTGQDNSALTVVVFPHRRIRMTGLVHPDAEHIKNGNENVEMTPALLKESLPLAPFNLADLPIATVENLEDEPFDPEDLIIKATAKEVISSLKEISNLNHLLRYLIHNSVIKL